MASGGHMFLKTWSYFTHCSICEKWIMPLKPGVQCGWCGQYCHADCVCKTETCDAKVKEEKIAEVVLERRLKRALSSVNGPVVDLGFEKIGDEGIGVLCDTMSIGSDITTLNLCGNRLTDDGFSDVAKLFEVKKVAVFSIASNLITSKSVVTLSSLYRSCFVDGICHLNISNNQLGDINIPDLCNSISNNNRSSLSSLNISNCKLSEESIVLVVDSIGRKLQLLDIGSNIYIAKPSFMSKLLNCLNNSSIVDFRFKGSTCGRLGDDGAVNFGQFLKKPLCRLTSVDLSNNSIGDDGVLALSQGLYVNSSLQSLDLSKNIFTDKSVTVLSQCVERKETLNCLDVCGVNISKSMIQLLADLQLSVTYDNQQELSSVTSVTGLQQGSTWYGWCSGCYNSEEHIVVRPKLIRSLYQCRGCSQISVRCSVHSCNSMANYHHNGPNLFCAAHSQNWIVSLKRESDSSVIVKWGNKPKLITRWCSWCLLLSPHKLRKTNIVESNCYSCTSCCKFTFKCIRCYEGMARGSGETSCVKCSKHIKKWMTSKSKIKQTLSNWNIQSRWCSWCIEVSDHILLYRGLLRNSYQCTSCYQQTTTCARCETGMSCGGLLCSQCEHVFVASFSQKWDLHSEGKHLIFSGETQRSLQDDLSRQSNYKTLAQHSGLIRPFLLLVAMGPSARVSAGLLLGVSLPKCVCFGDSHSESWFIITKKMLPKCRTPTEKLNIIMSQTLQWATVLRRVADAYRPGLSDHITSSEEGEILLLRIFAEAGLGRMSDCDINKYSSIVKSSESSIVELKRRLSRNGITDERVVLFTLCCILTLKSSAQSNDSPVRSANTTSIARLISDHIALQDGSSVSCGRLTSPSNLASAAFFIATPLSIPFLACSVVRSSLSASPLSLIPLLSSLLTQRLLLAAEGINIRDFS